MSKPGTAAVLSFVVPGIGQIYNGAFLRGIFWLLITPGFWVGSGGTLGWLCHLLSAYTAYRFAEGTLDRKLPLLSPAAGLPGQRATAPVLCLLPRAPAGERRAPGGIQAAMPDAALPPLLDDDPRLRILTPGEPGHRGAFVVYWAQFYRRARCNAALELAIHEANRRRLPLVVYEALRVDYPHASDRVHAFVLEGAAAEAQRYRERGAGYAFFLPRTPGEARGALASLARQAALIVTDDFPSFIGPAHARAAAKFRCPVWAFDDNAVVPLSLLSPEQYAARTIRPRVHRQLSAWLRPLAERSCEAGPARVDWPFAPLDVESTGPGLDALLASLPIDHVPARCPGARGGSANARARLGGFLKYSLPAYLEHNHPDRGASSGLSPYLHFGMIGAREVALAARDARGPADARDALIEQLLVRRTLAFNLARENPAHRTLEALPAWARASLDARLADPRPVTYTRDQLEQAATHDPVWNAAQRELRATGVIHNYLRMLWGKSVILWKKTPGEAFDDLVYLNDRWALDGRDPNSYASILWCFGKHDRPWGPARPVLGTVRYMSTEAAARKLHMEKYLERWCG